MQVAQGHGWSGWRGEKKQQQKKKRRHSLLESEREPQMGREGRDESDRGGGGKAVTLASSPTLYPPPHPPPPRWQAALAVPCSGEERLLKPGPGLHVWTQSLALPLQTNGAECKPAVAAAPSSSSPRDSEMRKREKCSTSS